MVTIERLFRYATNWLTQLVNHRFGLVSDLLKQASIAVDAFAITAATAASDHHGMNLVAS